MNLWSFIFCLLQNEESNGHFKNASFKCADVTSSDLEFEDESLDLIFSNWLLMYLSDEEVMVSRSQQFFFINNRALI